VLLSLQVSIRGPSRASTLAQDNGDGTYFIAYMADTSGQYHLDVRVCTEAVPGSPFPIHVLSGQCDPRRCLLAGSGLGRAAVGEPAEFTITSVDQHGNHMVEGGELFTVALTDEESARPQFLASARRNGNYDASCATRPCTYDVNDLDDGTYVVRYCTKVSGAPFLHILHGSNIAGPDSRPLLVAVLNYWVTDTNDPPAPSRTSTILAKSPSDRVSRSIL
jgi:hypothetical protein